MKRTTIKLPDELDARLRFEAERRGMTISELTREAIAAHLGAAPARRLRAAGAGAGRWDQRRGPDRRDPAETGFGEDAWS